MAGVSAVCAGEQCPADAWRHFIDVSADESGGRAGLWGFRSGGCWLQWPALLRTGELSDLLLFFFFFLGRLAFFLFKVS